MFVATTEVVPGDSICSPMGANVSFPDIFKANLRVLQGRIISVACILCSGRTVAWQHPARLGSCYAASTGSRHCDILTRFV